MKNKPAERTKAETHRADHNTDHAESNKSSPAEESAKVLTKAEGDLLIELETKIGSGLASFVEVGQALNAVNADRLYRGQSKTFEDYCEQRWGISRQHGYRLVKASQCFDLLKSGLPGGALLPSNESQLRPLVDHLEPKVWLRAWKRVIATTRGVKMTAEAVEKAISGLLGKSRQSNTPVCKKARPNVSKGLADVVELIERTLGNERTSISDLKSSLKSVLLKLKGLQVGSLRPSK